MRPGGSEISGALWRRDPRLNGRLDYPNVQFVWVEPPQGLTGGPAELAEALETRQIRVPLPGPFVDFPPGDVESH
jgi:hypothetical protein